MEEETKKSLIKERMRILLDTRAEFSGKIRPCVTEDVSKLYRELDDHIDRILSEEAKVLTSKEA